MSRKQGHWIDHGTIKNYPQEGFNNYHLLVCSECGCMHRTRLQDGVGKPFNANYCPNCGAIMIEPKPQTNADRIRNMTDEELAEFFSSRCDIRVGIEACDNASNCKKCFFEWLQAEVEEGAE